MAFKRTANKLESLFFTQATATGDKLELGEETKGAVLALVNEYNYLSDFGENVAISALNKPSQGSIIVFKHPNVYLRDKTSISDF